MEKEFVPYELALRMKQLGFNERCIMHWWKGKLSYYQMGDFSPTSTSAPLYQQAFKWIMQFPPLNKWACNIAVYSDGTYSIKDGKYAVHEYLSSEECLEKLIEIVEQKEK